MKNEITDPNRLFNAVKEACEIRSDAELARCLGMTPANLCNMRKRRIQIGATAVVRVMDATGFSLMRIQGLLGEKVW